MSEGNIGTLAAPAAGAAALAIVALSVLLHILYLVLIRRRSAEASAFPRGPPAWPIVGHLPLLIRARPHQALADLCMNLGYGPLLGLRLGSHRAVVVSSATLAKELLLTHDKAFANRVPYLFANALLYGYNSSVGFSSYNPQWVRMRKIYTLELFTAKRMHELSHVRHDEVRKVLKRLWEASRGGTHAVDVGMHIAEMSANTTARVVQSKTLKEVAPELPELMRVLEDQMFPTLGDFLPMLKFMDALPKRRMERLHDRIDKVLDSIIQQRRQLLSSCPPPHELPNDVLQVLMSQNKDEEFISDDGIKANMLDIFGAGIHTSTSTIEWAIAELLQNPTCLQKLHDEVDHVTKDNHDIVTDEDILKMSYLENVVKEVLRLHPIVPLLLPRVSSIDCKVGDYTLPKGTQAFINVWAIARDPCIWNKPQDFFPERFEGNDLDMRGQHYELLPFGAGRRMCPGMRLGISIVEVALANLIKFFDWKLPEGQNPISIDMTEKACLAVSKASPVLAIPKLKQVVSFIN